MLTKFICPDGQTTNITSCMEACRMGERCLTKSTLQELAKVRPWTGTPSTTQLLNGTLQAFLEIKHEYAEAPKKMMYRLLGTKVHATLDANENDESLGESKIGRMTDSGVSGLPDLVEQENGLNILTDYKVSGAFKIAKALGMYYTMEPSPNEVYKQATNVTMPDGTTLRVPAGAPKMVKTWHQDISKQDCFDWVMQLNHYRLLLKKQRGIDIHMMRIQAIVRDGGTMTATNYGVSESVYMIPIPTMPDADVEAFFARKAEALKTALERDAWDVMCDDRESWSGRKCKGYCSVKQFCQFMKDA